MRNSANGFAITGTYTGGGPIPIKGEGARLLWHPGKTAFRAGIVNGNQWDNAQMGAVSVAMGHNTTASGLNSTALGHETTASGFYSTAMGNGTGDASRSDALVLDFNGNMSIAGTLSQNSDRRLKTKIEPLELDVIDKLGQIRPVRYHFKDITKHPAGEQLGLIVQNVQLQFPELVSEAGNGTLSLSYSKFTTVLLKGLQEQQTKIERLEERLWELENRHGTRAALGSNVTTDPDKAMLLLCALMLVGCVLFWRQRT